MDIAQTSPRSCRQIRRGSGTVSAVSLVLTEHRGVPREIMTRVSQHARELGREVASDDLFLLALTEGDECRPVYRALASAGVTSERLLEVIRVGGDVGEERARRGLHFAPAFYTLLGLAQGFAATLGDGTITSEHVLLAVLWNESGHALGVLTGLGVSRELIVEHLRAVGVVVPATAVPAVVDVEWGERVWFERDDVAQVLDHVTLHLPPGTRWGFNYEGARAWVFSESSIDLETLVDEARSQD